MKLLRHLGGHDQLLWLSDIMVSPPTRYFKDVYLVSDLYETDLAKILESRQVLSEAHVRYFTYQLCRAVKFLHSAGILHRDLKPSNLLVNSNCDLVVADLGLARPMAAFLKPAGAGGDAAGGGGDAGSGGGGSGGGGSGGSGGGGDGGGGGGGGDGGGGGGA